MARSLHNRKYLKGFRKELRNNPTKAESMLWKALQRRQLKGRKFRRQHSIQNYIVDFYCSEEQLIVELDGAVHHNMVNEQYDLKRAQELRRLGFKLLRFENDTVFEQLDMVLEAISAAFGKREDAR
ncbi:endonuclease domain-containing protein [Flavobacteriaceae bacterium TP-CH-4]|uniref:Endonuclease domain-containing protein n=1 Tax=Pelagihabitans pacificus TaxID=2696054 RepID=A0A967AWS9_9FLAO|nr:endonuclease domain-containing protein [Pelagihabitans pacificus]NHF61344.1 endonuclease domain-containing protein [Pelagihabitans pacificus]